MTKTIEEKHQIEPKDKEQISDILKEALNDPDFKGITVWLGQEWSSGSFTNAPKKVFKVTVQREHEYATDNRL